MSTAAVSSASITQQQYLQSRHSDLKQLQQALKSGDLAGAQAAYKNIVALGQSGPFATRNPFKQTQRAEQFNAVGEALKFGDLAGAQHAFGALRATFQVGGQQVDPPGANPASGPEIILNLHSINSGDSGSGSPEQITINISNQANGGEKISIGIGSQGSTAEQVTLNLPANSNEQIVLNLLGASTTSGSTGPAASGGLSVSA